MIPKLWELVDHATNTLGRENVQVIWTYQNAARINKPYITLNYQSDDLPDFEWYSNYVDEDGLRAMGSQRKVVVDLQVYAGEDSMRLANHLAMLLSTEASLDKQQQLDVAVGTRLFLQRVPELLNNSQYEERAIYHFDFCYTESMMEDVSFIATVEIDGTYEGSKNHCLITVGIPYVDRELPPAPDTQIEEKT